MFATGPHTNPGAKTKTREQLQNTRELGSKKVQRGADIVLLAAAAIVFAGAKPCTAKIESQNRYANGIQRFRCLVDNFVVHGPAKKRMRVADYGGERGMRGGRWRPENRFEAS